MLELCISGHCFRICRRSSLAHTMNAFIGRLICGLLGSDLSFGERIIFATSRQHRWLTDEEIYGCLTIHM